MATAARTDRHYTSRPYDHVFFPGMAVFILATVFLGFARSYYLAGIFKAPQLPLLVHIHGAAFSSWMLLLITQTSLVAKGRVDVHRRLGLLGFGLACLMLIIGVMTATGMLAREFAPGEPRVGPFYSLPMMNLLTFSTLVYFAYRARFNPAAHKRLVLVGTIAILDAAFVRWPIFPGDQVLAGPRGGILAAECSCYALLSLLAGYDLWSTGRIHRATLWAGTLVVVLKLLIHPVGHTAAWHNFATWMQGLARSFH